MGAQLPLRLETTVEKQLQRAADRIGTTKSALIRLLAKTFVEQSVDDDGTVNLPPNWERLLDTSKPKPRRPKLQERTGLQPSSAVVAAVNADAKKDALAALNETQGQPPSPPTGVTSGYKSWQARGTAKRSAKQRALPKAAPK